MLDFGLHQQYGQQAQDLQKARWAWLLLARRMLDDCNQDWRKLQEAYQKIEESNKVPLIIVNYSPKTKCEDEGLCVHVYTVNILEKKTFSHKNIISK